MKLLERSEFREAVFKRDGYKCVNCDDVARPGVKLNAHHIIERRLFPDGGYYLENGATLCDHEDGGAGCHLMAEHTLISCEFLRERCGITTTVLPPHLSCENPICRKHNAVLQMRNAEKGRPKSAAVRKMWKAGQSEIGQEGEVKGLQPNLPETLELPPQAGSESPQCSEEWTQNESGRVYSNFGSSTQESQEVRVELCSGASFGSRNTSESSTEEERTGSSFERDSSRQSSRKPSSNDSGTPRESNLGPTASSSNRGTREEASQPYICLNLPECQIYDKWGNPILDNGQRLKGELFDDESVQKVLAPVLNLFTNRVKYPRTYHLPWSPGATDDDRIMEDPEACFGGREVVITEKMDGENCTMYRDYIHARSLEYAPHPSRDRVKAMWAQVAHDIPEGWRVCGENLYALHSIPYDDLASYFQVFSIWNDKNECLSWDETKQWAELLGFQTVPEIARTVWQNPTKIPELTWTKVLESQTNLIKREGYVVRLADSFHYKDFRRSVGKYVRANHVVHRDGHWSNRPVVPNKLK